MLDSYLPEYLPVLLFVFIGLAFGVVPFFLGKMLGPNRPGAGKMAAYECGFDAFEDARVKFDVRYYLIAILFILFDLEIAFLFPWAAVFNEFSVIKPMMWFMFGSVMVFLAILVIGYIVEWKNGALEWE
jgi:NADH-quinone oxidoreductase subunit A